MSAEKIEAMLPNDEELLEMGYDPQEYEMEARAEKEAEGLVESNIVGE